MRSLYFCIEHYTVIFDARTLEINNNNNNNNNNTNNNNKNNRKSMLCNGMQYNFDITSEIYMVSKIFQTFCGY